MSAKKKGKSPPPARTSGRRPQLDPALVGAALVELRGNVAGVARRFGVHRSSVQELVGKNPALRLVAADARQGMLDDAESALYRAVIAGEAWAVCFFLKTQGKDRGYVEKQVHEHTGTARLLITRVVVQRGDGNAHEPGPALPGSANGYPALAGPE